MQAGELAGAQADHDREIRRTFISEANRLKFVFDK